MTGRQATRTRQKYKDSCTHCAGAKVRCSKEKPRCTRCNERSLECSYGLSYRYGRLPARAKLSTAGYIDQTTMKTSVPRELIPSGSRAPSPSEPATVQMSWLSESNTINGFTNVNYHDPHTPNNFMGHAYDTGTAPLAPVAAQAYQALTPTSDPTTFSTINYIPCLDSLNHPAPRRQHSRSVSSASSMPSGYDYTFSNASPVTFGTPPETPRARPVQNYAPSMQHDCLSQAAATLLSLRHDPTSGPGKNQDMMEYILHMIGCECFGRDSHVRMFVVLIGFEVMDQYLKTTQDMTLANGNTLEDFQAVLKLIERLLRRLRETGTGDYAQGLAPSFAVFGQLEADLRKHLRGISQNAVGVLRRV